MFANAFKSSQKVYNLNVDRGKNICYTINGIKANKNPNGIFRGNGRFYENEVSPMAIEAAFQYAADPILSVMISAVKNINGSITEMKSRSLLMTVIEYFDIYIGNKPSTGDNSVLYLIISAAALAAMSAVVVRRRRAFE